MTCLATEIIPYSVAYRLEGNNSLERSLKSAIIKAFEKAKIKCFSISFDYDGDAIIISASVDAEISEKSLKRNQISALTMRHIPTIAHAIAHGFAPIENLVNVLGHAAALTLNDNINNHDLNYIVDELRYNASADGDIYNYLVHCISEFARDDKRVLVTFGKNGIASCVMALYERPVTYLEKHINRNGIDASHAKFMSEVDAIPHIADLILLNIDALDI